MYNWCDHFDHLSILLTVCLEKEKIMLNFLKKKKDDNGSKTREFDVVETGEAGKTQTGEINNEETAEAEIIKLDSPLDLVIVDDLIKYVGLVVSTHEGFSYIGDVKKGYETINTNGDVFVPQVFEVGCLVQFCELNNDPKRPGKFRTESADVIKGALARIDNETRAMTIHELSARTPYHSTAKDIDPAQVKQAAENKPFAEMTGIYKKIADNGVPLTDIEDAIKGFLAGTYANLYTIGVDYSIDGLVDINAEQAKLDEAVATYEQNGMTGQVESVKSEYESFVGVRGAFELMKESGILGVDSIIPIKYLPDLLVTSPVWFVDSKHELSNNLNEDDPEPDHAIKYFCDAVGSHEFAWFYQIYNRRTRPINTFQGRDIMPLPIVKILENARKTFDYVVIATPYHDIASKEWSDPDWLRNLDPFLFGFMKNLPYMFLLGRWSGTGLFPLMCDMVADTMNHLRINKSMLNNFLPNSYWNRGVDSKNYNNNLLSPSGGGT